MTLIWTASFDTAGTAVHHGWTTTGTTSPVADRYGASLAVRGSNFPTGTYTRTLAAADQHNTLVLGIAVKSDSDETVGTYSQMWAFRDAAGATRATMWAVCTDFATKAWKIEVRVGSASGGTLLATTTVAVFDGGSWYYVEVKYITHASTGSIIIKVNELQVASATNIDTTGGLAGTLLGSYVLSLHRDSTGLTGFWWVDDHYACNGAGSVNNDFLGDVRVVQLRPNVDGANEEWTAGGAGFDATNHYENVNDAVTTVTRWNASPIDEATELYGVANLPVSATGAILGVKHSTAMWASALNIGVAQLVRDSTTIAEGTEQALNTLVPSATTNVYSTISETRPGGGIWTAAEIDAMQIGVRVKSVT